MRGLTQLLHRALVNETLTARACPPVAENLCITGYFAAMPKRQRRGAGEPSAPAQFEACGTRAA